MEYYTTEQGMETVSVGVASLPEVKVSAGVCKTQPNKETLYWILTISAER